jgi:hypothetical protein
MFFHIFKILFIIPVPQRDGMIKTINKVFHILLHQTEVVDHLTVVKEIGFEKYLDDVRVTVDRGTAALGRTASDNMGVLEFKLFSYNHKVIIAF